MFHNIYIFLSIINNKMFEKVPLEEVLFKFKDEKLKSDLISKKLILYQTDSLYEFIENFDSLKSDYKYSNSRFEITLFGKKNIFFSIPYFLEIPKDIYLLKAPEKTIYTYEDKFQVKLFDSKESKLDITLENKNHEVLYAMYLGKKFYNKSKIMLRHLTLGLNESGNISINSIGPINFMGESGFLPPQYLSLDSKFNIEDSLK